MIDLAMIRLTDPKRVMIVSKIGDANLIELTRDLALWLIDRQVPSSENGHAGQLEVYVELRLCGAFEINAVSSD